MRNLVALSAKSERTKKGIAKPNVKTTSSRLPTLALLALLAIMSTEDKTGPIQGVQPREKAAPRKNAERGVIDLTLICFL